MGPDAGAAGAGGPARDATPLRRPRRPTLAARARAALRAGVGAERFAAMRSVARMATGKELRAPIPIGEKLWAWRAGFRATNAALYGIGGRHEAAGEYVSDYVRLYRCPTINAVPELFDNKLLLHGVLRDHGFTPPELVAVVERHGATVDPLGPGRARVTPAELERRLLADGGRFIVKPHNGTFGRAIGLVEPQDGRLVVRRGAVVRPFVAARDCPPVTLVERAVEQGAFWAALSPHSTNTLRVLTMWTPGEPAPFIGRAVQRVGTAATLPTDNWSGGGICALVEPATGRLGVGRTNPAKAGGTQHEFTHHPETGAPIAGAVLPGWADVAATVLRAAASLPFARYIGWDVAVDRAGAPVFIEGNNNTDVNLLQVHGGLLAEPRVRRFYEACGVL